MLITKDIAIARKKIFIKQRYDYCCFHCGFDLSTRPGQLEIHHRDYLGYLQLADRNPFNPRIAIPLCSSCHFEVHIAASAITLGLIRIIPINSITRFLIRELKMSESLVYNTKYELLRIGISEFEIGFADESLVCRILLHALIEEYFDDLEERLEKNFPFASLRATEIPLVPST
jgi:hypothetical protein